MTQDTLILVGLGILAVPLLGTAVAMTLGLLTTLTRQAKRGKRGVPRIVDADSALETGLRRVAAMLGCYLLDRLPARTVPARGPDVVRVTPDRRITDRRGISSARRSIRADAERRRQDRRQRERRRWQDGRQRV